MISHWDGQHNMWDRFVKWLFHCQAIIIRFSVRLRFVPHFAFVTYNQPGYKFRDTSTVLKIVKPGDIILRSFDGYVNGAFIPGFYKHVAIVVNKNNVIHALNRGVIEDDLIQFCRTDHICIMRKRGINQTKRMEIVSRARELIGKQYDYNFNLDLDAIYCSEVVSYAYKNVIDFHPHRPKLWGFVPLKNMIAPNDYALDSRLTKIYQST